MNVEKTGQLIAQRRKARGLTQRDLAERLRVSDRAVSKWERGLNLPNAELFEPLCELLGVSILELLRGEVNPAEHIAVSEAETAVSSAAELARLRERRAKGLRRCCVVLAVLAVLLGLFAARQALVRSAEQAYERELFAQPSFWLKVTIVKPEPSGKTEILNSVSGTVYHAGMAGELTPETAELAINRREGQTRTIELDDALGYSFVYLSIYGEKKDMHLQVYRWERSLLGTDATIRDAEPVTATEEDGRWSVRVESGYVYSVLVLWEGRYFAEFPFQTESIFE